MVEQIGQTVGIVAMIVAFLSYQAKTTKGIAAVQSISGSLFAVHFFMLGAYSGFAMNIFGIVRNLFYVYGKKKWSSHIAAPITFCAIFAVAGVLSWVDTFSILPTVGMAVSSFTYWMDNAKIGRRLCLITSACWLAYNIHCGAIGAILVETFSIPSILIAIVRYDLLKKNAGGKA